MKKILILSIVTFTLACGPDSHSGRGNCSSEFISAYNTVRWEATGFKPNLQTLKSLCSQFFNKYGNVRCVASVTREGQLESAAETISAQDLKSVCDLGNQKN